MEHWKPIPGWVGLYEVSSSGRVRSIDRIVQGRHGPTFYRGRVLRPGGGKYRLVNLVETGLGRRSTYYIHDLVLLAFAGPKPAGLEACHGILGPENNSINNLRYDTRSENALDRGRFGDRARKKAA